MIDDHELLDRNGIEEHAWEIRLDSVDLTKSNRSPVWIVSSFSATGTVLQLLSHLLITGFPPSNLVIGVENIIEIMLLKIFDFSKLG